MIRFPLPQILRLRLLQQFQSQIEVTLSHIELVTQRRVIFDNWNQSMINYYARILLLAISILDPAYSVSLFSELIRKSAISGNQFNIGFV
jgi:hypothetical protein